MSDQFIAPEPDDRIDPELYGRYLTGAATAAERDMLERWARTAQRQRLLAAAIEKKGIVAARTDGAWALLEGRIHAGRLNHTMRFPMRLGKRFLPTIHATRTHRRTIRTVLAALSAGMLVVMGVRFAPRGAHPRVGHTYTTGAGEQAVIRLGDGSRVILAPGSRMTVEDQFGKQARRIELSGEAYFDVVTVSNAPFLVRTGRITTQVLGTVFDIKSYPDDRVVQVAVVQGKVTSGTAGAAIALTAGMVARLTDSTANTRRPDDLTEYTSWTDGRLVFHRAPVGVMLQSLSRWTGYEFRLADSSLIAQHVTATLSVGNRRETLAALKDLLDVTMTFDKNIVTLRAIRSVAVPRTESHKRLQDSLFHKELGK